MIFLYIIGGIIILFFILALIAPKQFHIMRSIEISKPLPEVFKYLKYIKNQEEWSPWEKKDPNMKHEYTGTDGEVGFVSRWEGNKNVGVGEQEISRIVDNEIIEVNMRFYKPWKSESEGYTKVENVGEGNTKVIWGFHGINKVPSNIFMMFFNMDKAVGGDFEEGLASLKQILEK